MSTTAPAWTLGECIRKARSHADLEQADLAERLNVSESLISKWERGYREPKLTQLAQIESICGVPHNWIITNATLVLPPSAWSTADELVAA